MLIITSFPFLLSGSDKLKSGTSFENPKMWNCHISPAVAQEAATEKNTSVRDCPSEPCGQNQCECVCLHSEQNLQLLLCLIQNRAAVRTSALSDGYELWCHETPTSVVTTGSWSLDKGSVEAVLRAAAYFFTRSQSLGLVVDLLSLQPVSSCCDRTVQTRHKTRTPHISQAEQPTQPKETTRASAARATCCSETGGGCDRFRSRRLSSFR